MTLTAFCVLPLPMVASKNAKKKKKVKEINQLLVCSFRATVETCGARWQTLWKRTRSLCGYKYYSGLLLGQNTTILDLRSLYNNSIVIQCCL